MSTASPKEPSGRARRELNLPCVSPASAFSSDTGDLEVHVTGLSFSAACSVPL